MPFSNSRRIFKQVNLNSGQGIANYCMAFCCVVGLFVFPVVVSLLALMNNHLLVLGYDPEFKDRWGTLYKEFNTSAGFWPAHLYTVFLIRRLLFILNVMLFNSVPKVQAILNAILALLVRLT